MCLPQAREKAQKAQHDEAGRVQQQAANKATQSALGAGPKWAAWGQKKGAATAAATAGVKRTAKGSPKPSRAGEPATPGTPGTPTQGNVGGDRTPMVTPSTGGRVGFGVRAPMATPVGWGGQEGPTIVLKDVVAALDRDPAYAKSSLMYQLLESADFF